MCEHYLLLQQPVVLRVGMCWQKWLEGMEVAVPPPPVTIHQPAAESTSSGVGKYCWKEEQPATRAVLGFGIMCFVHQFLYRYSQKQQAKQCLLLKRETGLCVGLGDPPRE